MTTTKEKSAVELAETFIEWRNAKRRVGSAERRIESEWRKAQAHKEVVTQLRQQERALLGALNVAETDYVTARESESA